MQLTSVIALAAYVGTALAQRPSNTSICDYYTTALLKENNATNQMTVLTLVVNTAVIGNYSKINVGITVPGILAKGTYNGTEVNLLPYFNGGLLSSNRGGSAGVSINFLDDGGAVPLTLNMPANGTSSNQYKLLTHLYSYFGLLLGCSEVGMPGFAAYSGSTNMYQVHKFMVLSNAEFGYFVTQVGLAAASFGVTQEDATAVGMSLSKAFGYKCEPEMSIPSTAAPQLQSMCTADDCPLSPNATCAAYQVFAEPSSAANSTSAANGTSTASATSSGATSSVTMQSTNAAATVGSVAGLVFGAAAFAMAL